MDTPIAHSGIWIFAVFMIVIASWMFYRYFAPSTWREWAGAGMVQAFIIALYAEMYGFPMTIYLLVRYFGLDKSHLNANLWSSLVGMGETGMFVAMVFGYGLLFVGIGLIIQGWRELHRARHQKRLVTVGLYALVRHPQYSGLFIALFGEGIVHWPTVFSVIAFPVIVLMYTLLARREENLVITEFGESYLEYQQRVPMFFPHWGHWKSLIQRSRLADDPSGSSR